MILSGIVKSSLIDFPGKIATVLFVPGCNYNCFYCHNRALIEDMDEILDMDELYDFLNRRKGLIDAVVLTGGEPTLHTELVEFFASIKALGYLTKIDTNGSNPKLIKQLIDAAVLDYVAVDYKTPAYKYKDICGEHADPSLVLETIRILNAANVAFEVRTTVIPQLSLEDLITMAQELPKVPRYVLNPYRKPIQYLKIHQALIDEAPYSEKQIAEFAEVLKLYQSNVVLLF